MRLLIVLCAADVHICPIAHSLRRHESFYALAEIPSCRKYNFTTKSMVNASSLPLLEDINMFKIDKNKGAAAIRKNTLFVHSNFGQTDYLKPT
jgi:hypothetical protein